MKHMKRAFAMLLCVAMVLSLCMTFAGAADVLVYDYLDEIPENKDIFLAIRTGKIMPVEIHGHWYYQFSNADYTVRVRATAFSAKPSNNYLLEDNIELSKNCKNAPVKDHPVLKDGGEYRVCYYKTRYYNLDDNGDTIYTYSMYRLELTATARRKDGELLVEARLTSGVSFDYNPNKAGEDPYSYEAFHRRDEKLPLRPSVSATVSNNSQDVRLVEYRYKGFGTYSAVSAGDAVLAGASAGACALGVKEALGMVETPWLALATATVACAPVAVTFITESGRKEYKSSDSIDYPALNPTITPPGKLECCNDYVRVIYTLNSTNYDYSTTNFLIALSFQ